MDGFRLFSSRRCEFWHNNLGNPGSHIDLIPGHALTTAKNEWTEQNSNVFVFYVILICPPFVEDAKV